MLLIVVFGRSPAPEGEPSVPARGGKLHCIDIPRRLFRRRGKLLLQLPADAGQVFPEQYGGMVARHFEEIETSSKESVPPERRIVGVQVSLVAVASAEQNGSASERLKLVVFQGVLDGALKRLHRHFIQRLVTGFGSGHRALN